MKVQAGYEEGHLVVAAIRVLTHNTEGRPPATEEISTLLSMSREWAGVLLAALEAAGAVRALTGPFETRFEVADHTALEGLPRAAAAATVDDELREFSRKKKQEDEKLRNLFASGEALKRRDKKMNRLADEMTQFKKKGNKGSSLFGDPPEDD